MGEASEDRVGPVLVKGEACEAIVGAMRELNQRVSVLDRGAYVRISVPFRCEVTRDAIEARLGARFRIPADLEKVMCSFKGKFTARSDRAVWEKEG